MDEYEQMLDAGYEKLPEISEEVVRFEIPKVRGHIQGNRTVISNFPQIATHIRRKLEHILKFISKELATKTDIKGTFVVFNAKVPASRINEKIESYVETYVLCKECKKPDTQLNKEGNFVFIKCMACGAKSAARSLR